MSSIAVLDPAFSISYSPSGTICSGIAASHWYVLLKPYFAVHLLLDVMVTLEVAVRSALASPAFHSRCFIRNGKADEWAGMYVERIQKHLDVRDESFSIDADNQSFPPSISGIQNGIIVYAIK